MSFGYRRRLITEYDGELQSEISCPEGKIWKAETRIAQASHAATFPKGERQESGWK
jgi:hypothetical protein